MLTLLKMLFVHVNMLNMNKTHVNTSLRMITCNVPNVHVNMVLIHIDMKRMQMLT